jgi:hypothetical protein
MKRLFLLFFLAPLLGLSAPVNVQRVGGAGADANDLTTSLVVPSGKVLNSSGNGVIDADTLEGYTPATLPVSTSQQAALDAKANAPTGTTTNTRVVTEGDSNSDVGRLGAGSWPTQLAALSNFSERATFANYATSGATISTLQARYTSSVYPNRPTGSVTRSYLIFGVGTNNLSTAVPATFLADWESYVSTAISDGFSVYAFTIPRYGDHPEYEAVRQAINKGIRETTLDVTIIDYDRLFPEAGQEPYYDDFIHVSAEGNAVLAGYINNAFTAGGSLEERQRPIQEVSYVPDNGLYANGISGYADISPAVTVGTSAYTCSGWVRPGVGGSTSLYLMLRSGAFGFAANANGNITVEGAGISSFFVKYAFKPETWYFLTLTRDGSGNLVVYVNGKAVYSTTGATGSVTGPNVIGANNSEGGLSEISFFSVAKTAQEVLDLYNSGGHPNGTANLVVNLPLREGYGTVSTGYGTTATFNGSNFTWLRSVSATPVAGGGTGASTLTGVLMGNGTSAITGFTTSAGLASAISDETGTGALVFGTAPTFTTSITVNGNYIGSGVFTQTLGGNLATFGNSQDNNRLRISRTGSNPSYIEFRAYSLNPGVDIGSTLNFSANNGATFATIGTTGILTGFTWQANVIGSAYGGAGTVNGIMKANGSGTVSAAVANTDYVAPGGNIGAATATTAAVDTNTTQVATTEFVIGQGYQKAGVGQVAAISTKTTTYSALTTDYTILCDATTAGFPINLPAAASNTGRIFNIKKTDATGNVVTIDANASETIDGSLSQTLDAQWESITIQSNGTAWFIL